MKIHKLWTKKFCNIQPWWFKLVRFITVGVVSIQFKHVSLTLRDKDINYNFTLNNGSTFLYLF